MSVGHMNVFFGELSLHILCPFFKRVIAFWVLRRLSSLCILDVNSLLDKLFMNIFSHNVGCLFLLLMVYFAVQKLLVQCSPTCSYFILFLLPEEMCSGKSCPSLYSRDFCLCFLLRVSWFHVLYLGL